jgi:hypothetical protein
VSGTGEVVDGEGDVERGEGGHRHALSLGWRSHGFVEG